MSNAHYLSEQASLADLFKRMMSPDREVIQEYQHMKVEQCFINRLFVVYKPTGLTADRQHRSPEILTQIRVTGFRADAETGAQIDIEDTTTHQVMTVKYVPQRLFHYDVFVSVPPKQRLHWDAQVVGGLVKRSMGFQMLVKVRTKADFYSAGATGMETPVGFRELYPEVNIKLNN
jgi:hypothetical protein